MFRPFSVLAPRVFQFISWSFDPGSLSQPFLQNDPVERAKVTVTSKIQRVLYKPPLYVPTKLKQTF